MQATGAVELPDVGLTDRPPGMGVSQGPPRWAQRQREGPELYPPCQVRATETQRSNSSSALVWVLWLSKDREPALDPHVHRPVVGGGPGRFQHLLHTFA